MIKIFPKILQNGALFYTNIVKSDSSTNLADNAN